MVRCAANGMKFRSINFVSSFGLLCCSYSYVLDVCVFLCFIILNRFASRILIQLSRPHGMYICIRCMLFIKLLLSQTKFSTSHSNVVIIIIRISWCRYGVGSGIIWNLILWLKSRAWMVASTLYYMRWQMAIGVFWRSHGGHASVSCLRPARGRANAKINIVSH